MAYRDEKHRQRHLAALRRYYRRHLGYFRLRDEFKKQKRLLPKIRFTSWYETARRRAGDQKNLKLLYPAS